MIKLGFLGAGNMGSALMRGVSQKPLFKLYAYDKNREKVEKLKEYGVSPCESEKELAEVSEYLVLAVKPQTLAEALNAAKAGITENHVIISICAGISADFIRELTNPEVKIAIAMPNTPAMLGVGATAVARDNKISDGQFNIVKQILEGCGIVREIPMDKMNEIICINGSSPAFIYLFAKGFLDYAEKNGIDNKTALDLFAKTLVGSAKMLTESKMTPDELIQQVSSPGGTTLAGLQQLYLGDLTQTVEKACEACTKRAYELGK